MAKPGSYEVMKLLCAEEVTVTVQDEYKLVTVKPYLTEDQLDTAVKPILEEYLEHGNSTEVEVSKLLLL